MPLGEVIWRSHLEKTFGYVYAVNQDRWCLLGETVRIEKMVNEMRRSQRKSAKRGLCGKIRAAQMKPLMLLALKKALSGMVSFIIILICTLQTRKQEAVNGKNRQI